MLIGSLRILITFLVDHYLKSESFTKTKFSTHNISILYGPSIITNLWEATFNNLMANIMFSLLVTKIISLKCTIDQLGMYITQTSCVSISIYCTDQLCIYLVQTSSASTLHRLDRALSCTDHLYINKHLAVYQTSCVNLPWTDQLYSYTMHRRVMHLSCTVDQICLYWHRPSVHPSINCWYSSL